MKPAHVGLLLILGCAGCVEVEVKLRDASTRPEPPPPAASVRPVTSDQVTPENARNMAQALWDELDRE